MNEKNGKSVLVRADGIQVQAWGRCAEEAGLSMNAWIKGVCDRASGLGVGESAGKVDSVKVSGGKKPREKSGKAVGVKAAPARLLNGYSQTQGWVDVIAGRPVEKKEEVRLEDECVVCLGKWGEGPVKEGEAVELEGRKGWLCRWCLSGREPGQERSIEDVVQECREGKTYVLDRERKFEPAREMIAGKEVRDPGMARAAEAEMVHLPAKEVRDASVEMTKENKRAVFEALKKGLGKPVVNPAIFDPEPISGTVVGESEEEDCPF